MGQRKYTVCAYNEPIAKGLTLEMALLFIKAYYTEYYAESEGVVLVPEDSD